MNTWLKVTCLHKFAKRTRAKLSITIENFKIPQLEDELELPKVQQKSEKYISQTDHRVVNWPISILFTFV
jgi:hypothetical protein